MDKRTFRGIIGLFSIVALFNLAGHLGAAEAKTFEIEAKKYEFIPEKIEVNQGDKVTLKVTAMDTDHGLGIEKYDIDQVLPEGQTVTIEFIADKKGSFTIKCTKFCGWGHFGMKGELVVK